MSVSDGELVEGLLRGDRRAFEQFFNEYYPKLYRFVKRRMPQDATAAEDIAQGTLCRALESLPGYRGEAALFTWLCTLCRREMSARWDETRAWSSAPRLVEDDPAIRAALESLLAREQWDPLFAADREQVRNSILSTLDYLPAPYGDILEWKYLRDMSMGEIARRLGRSPKAVESLLTRAREAFRETFSVLSGGQPAGELP
jgi:RNA polymerase sigma-70 factor (ECF subfamily)